MPRFRTLSRLVFAVAGPDVVIVDIRVKILIFLFGFVVAPESHTLTSNDSWHKNHTPTIYRLAGIYGLRTYQALKQLICDKSQKGYYGISSKAFCASRSLPVDGGRRVARRHRCGYRGFGSDC